MSFLTLENIECRLRNETILPRLSLSINQGQFACLLGPSGSGKTTLLRLIAGLETPHAGRVLLSGEDITKRPPEKRGIGMVFQDAALFPHLSVAQNIGFALPKKQRSQRVALMLKHIELEDRAGAMPHELSGGQQHRVALARALAPAPKLLLLDEAFAHLDPQRRGALREQTKQLASEQGVTCLMVTHDAEEAMQTGDILLLMDAQGRLHQQGTPHDVFHHPANRYAAEALGEINVLEASSDGVSITSALGCMQARTNLKGKLQLALRPQGVRICEKEHGTPAVIERVTCTGPEDLLLLKLQDGQQLKARLAHTHHWREGDAIGVCMDEDYSTVFEL